MLEKAPGVMVALPFCDTGRVEVWASKVGALDKKRVASIIELEPDFKLIAFRAVVPAAAKAKVCVKKQQKTCAKKGQGSKEGKRKKVGDGRGA
jgi:hypothetical protein